MSDKTTVIHQLLSLAALPDNIVTSAPNFSATLLHPLAQVRGPKLLSCLTFSKASSYCKSGCGFEMPKYCSTIANDVKLHIPPHFPSTCKPYSLISLSLWFSYFTLDCNSR